MLGTVNRRQQRTAGRDGERLWGTRTFNVYIRMLNSISGCYELVNSSKRWTHHTFYYKGKAVVRQWIVFTAREPGLAWSPPTLLLIQSLRLYELVGARLGSGRVICSDPLREREHVLSYLRSVPSLGSRSVIHALDQVSAI